MVNRVSQLFPKRCQLSNLNRTENNLYKYQGNVIENDTIISYRRPQQKFRVETVSNKLLGDGGGEAVIYFTAPASPTVSEVVQNI